MKALVRGLATLGLVGSTLLGGSFVENLRSLALTEEQIVQKLGSVPVYVITNPQGLPLTRPVTEGRNTVSVTGVYLSRQEAQAFVDDLRNVKDPDPKLAELSRSLQVTAVPMGVIYKQVRETANQPNRLVFAFKPVQQQVDAALALLRQSGQQVNQFPGVPVFIVRFGPDKGYVPIKLPQQTQEIIPLFLSKEDAQNLLGQVKAQSPTADIQVVDVDAVIETLRSQNEPWLNQIVLVPAPDSREYIRTRSGARGGSPQAAPAQQNRNRPQTTPNRNQPSRPQNPSR